MHTKRILFFAAFCLLTAGMIFAEESVITLGGKKGWSKIERMDGVVYGTGRYGYQSIVLDTNKRVAGDSSDLLLDFEDKIPLDRTGNYSVEENKLLNSTSSKMGKGAGLSRGKGGIRLSGANGSLFGTTGSTGSFLIEFWLCPSIAENGEMVFSWRSSRTEDNYPLYQMISAGFYNNHLQWRFTNVFQDYRQNGGLIELASYRTMIPNVWTHHSISYDQDSGLLEYRIDGKLEDMKYVTTNEKEMGGYIYSPILGVPADIEICPSYTGRIDDFHIQRMSESDSSAALRYDSYKKDGGRFVTEPILVGLSSVLNKIDAITTEPDQTDVVLYARAGDNYFNWTESEPAWVPVANHQQIENVKGKYLQVAVDLYTDGSGSKTPSVTQLDLHYTQASAPLPPFTLIAEPGNGQVTLTWSYSVDDSAGGYYVYYGERPGEYLGREAVQGSSPVNVGNTAKVTITGLKNGKIYYFAVATYSNQDERITGSLSKEVYARPLRK